jgi:UPF0271 protein
LRLRVDINCDLGESYGAFKVGNDERIMPHITSANIACGFHAGDPLTILQTVKLAKRCHVAVGAHPGYPDLLGFGRREMQLTAEEVESYTIYQAGALEGFTRTMGIDLQHLKPHGALYNTAAKDERTSDAIVNATKALNPNLIVFAPPKSKLAKTATKAGLRVAYEAFADRAYNSDGTLVSRKQPASIIQNARLIAERVMKIVSEGTVLAIDDSILDLGEVHTVCVHGDTPGAADLVRILKKGLIKARIKVEPVSAFI